MLARAHVGRSSRARPRAPELVCGRRDLTASASRPPCSFRASRLYPFWRRARSGALLRYRFIPGDELHALIPSRRFLSGIRGVPLPLPCSPTSSVRCSTHDFTRTISIDELFRRTRAPLATPSTIFDQPRHAATSARGRLRPRSSTRKHGFRVHGAARRAELSRGIWGSAKEA